MSEFTSIPQVRFSKFKNKWSKTKLNSVLLPSKQKNKKHSFSRTDVLSVTQEYGLVNQIEYLGRSYAGEDLSNYGVVLKGDIVYTKSPLKSAPYGIIKENKYLDGIVSTLYAIYKVKQNYFAGFVDRYFELTDNLNKYLRPLVHKGAKNDMKISPERVLVDSIFVPSFDEQVRISEFFDKLDQMLRLRENRISVLNRLRKATSQKIFSREIIIRNERGEPYPNWCTTKLEKFLIESKILGTKGDEAKKLTVKLWGKGVFEKANGRDGSQNTQYYKRKKGQFIYSKLDFLNCAFGVIPEELDGYESTVDLPCFDVVNGLDPQFLLEKVKRPEFYQKYGALADGGRKAKRVHADTFLKFPIELPSVEEQKKIVKVFDILDRKIALEEKKLAQIRTLKKSLLQKMFV